MSSDREKIAFLKSKQYFILILFIIFVSIFLTGFAVASYLMIAPSSVPVTVNPPNPFSVGPGWSFP